MERKPLSFIDLYSGAGGLSLGLSLSDAFLAVASIERDKTVFETYEKNIGIKGINKKVEDVEVKDVLSLAKIQGYENIDVLVGGPPCQSFTSSNTGNTGWGKIKKELEMKEITMEHLDWYTLWNFINELKPTAVLIENVMGIKRYPEITKKFTERLESIGYTVLKRELKAELFNVPQKRRRIFICGVMNFTGNSELILPINSIKPNNKIITVNEAIGDLPELSNLQSGKVISNYKRGKPTQYQAKMRGNNKILYDHVIHVVHKKMAKRFEYIPQGYNLRKTIAENKIPENILKSSFKRGKSEIKFSDKTLKNLHSNIYRRLHSQQASFTITHIRKTVIIHPYQNRLLSVREAARLQSFPDWYRFTGSLSQQYQQIANAVPPFLAKAIGLHLNQVIRKIKVGKQQTGNTE